MTQRPFINGLIAFVFGGFLMFGFCWVMLSAQSAVVRTTVVSVPKFTVVEIGSLPTCNAGAKGSVYMVSDALLPAALATVSAGGAISVPVVCNGSAWTVF